MRLEANRLENGVNWYEARLSVVREAVRKYLAESLYLLTPTAYVLTDIMSNYSWFVARESGSTLNCFALEVVSDVVFLGYGNQAFS